MNYIKELQKENTDLKNRLSATEELLNDLVVYCQSSKFKGGPENRWMNPDDIIRRIHEGKININLNSGD